MKHSRRSIRLPNYDYAQEGMYFVTICTYEKEYLLGDIVDSKIHLNNIGRIVDEIWSKLNKKYKNIEMDEYVIMPNHLHGIIHIVGAGFSRPNKNSDNISKGQENPAPTLGQIIAYFKYETTKQINIIQNNPAIKFWQRNYYEHVIRDDKDLFRIREYISFNPDNWEEDKYYQRNFKGHKL